MSENSGKEKISHRNCHGEIPSAVSVGFQYISRLCGCARPRPRPWRSTSRASGRSTFRSPFSRTRALWPPSRAPFGGLSGKEQTRLIRACSGESEKKHRVFGWLRNSSPRAAFPNFTCTLPGHYCIPSEMSVSCSGCRSAMSDGRSGFARVRCKARSRRLPNPGAHHARWPQGQHNDKERNVLEGSKTEASQYVTFDFPYAESARIPSFRASAVEGRLRRIIQLDPASACASGCAQRLRFGRGQAPMHDT